ncbi:MAG TPA: plasmid partitioning protein RepB C-terminal domain-containing protein [Burkholderiaceae bacterium]|jgi:ParB family chromosome partitioning protein
MKDSARIEMVPIEAISVSNPRVRNPKTHKEITDNIDSIGLKRPITLRRLPDADGAPQYALICGQGRLESCKALGQASIAALVVSTDEETGHVMSLTENIARRMPRGSEMLEQVGALRSKGYTDAEIGRKIGYSTTWVSGVVNLLDKGERRLLVAAEVGHVPLSIAVQIAHASEAEAQEILLEAYNRGELKGRKVSLMRRLLETRMRSGLSADPGDYARPRRARKMSSEELTAIYQQNAEEHRQVQRRAEHTRSTLLVMQQIFKVLLSEPDFCSLLKSEGMTTIPRPLMDLVLGAGVAE